LTKLATNRRDDRNRQISRSSKHAYRNRLQPCQRCDNRFDAARALGQPDRPLDIIDDSVKQRHAGRS
jgi:hypothetical protein